MGSVMNSASSTITSTLPYLNTGGLSLWVIGIIVLCVVCGLVLAGFCAFFIIKQHRRDSISAKMATTTTTKSLDHEPDEKKPKWRGWPFISASNTDDLMTSSSKQKTSATTMATSRTMLDDIPLPPIMTPPTCITKAPFEEGYDPKAFLPPSICTNTTCDDSVSVNDPCLLESLERQKQINDMYYKGSSRHRRQSPSWGSSTIIQPPCIGNSSLLSLSMIEKQEQEAELQQLSISSYHVW
ncbi:hypothetical protein BC941DRAFT_431053 [Chlamydoabsidia padenii]|nr:hypothetical protein BC941DRAFT_431053 [Chlamydoabsidia padenii]